jgi:predicted kinase
MERRMKTIMILKGIPCSGKSTWAMNYLKKHPNEVKRVNKDELRWMLNGTIGDFEDEKIVLAIRDFTIEKALSSGFSVIVDDTNFKDKHFYAICDVAKRVGNIRVFEKFFRVDLKEALKRNATREHPVPESIIIGMFENNVKGKEVELRDLYFGFKGDYYTKIETVPGRESAIIVDVDGSLALNLKGRDYFDLDHCDEDTLNSTVADIVRLYFKNNHMVLVMSGREEAARAVTEKWLNKYDVPFHHLFMRETGDTRSDTIVKKEMFDSFIKDKFNVLFAIDDRKKVCRMYRGDLNIPVLQLDDVDF